MSIDNRLVSMESAPKSESVFIGREQEIADFKDTLERITHQGYRRPRVYEYYGVPGIGKSALINRFDQAAEQFGSYHVKIDFKEAHKTGKDYLKDPILLLEDVADGLAASRKISLKDFHKHIKSLRASDIPAEGIIAAYNALDQEGRLFKRPKWLEELRSTMISLIKTIDKLPEKDKLKAHHPVALLFDDAEYAAIPLMDFAEEWLINPLSQLKDTVIVWTARRPWRWKRPEIRFNLASRKLESFDEAETLQLAKSSGGVEIPRETNQLIFRLTNGLPQPTTIAALEAKRIIANGRTPTPEDLISKVYKEFIEGYALKNYNDPKVRTAIKRMSLVRFFDDSILKKVLQNTTGGEFKHAGWGDLHELSMDLKRSQLLVWKNGYAIDPAISHIVRNYCILKEPEIYINASLAALNVVKYRLTKPVDNRSLFIEQELYHTVALANMGLPVNPKTILEQRLAEYATCVNDQEALYETLERLEGNIIHDRELEILTGSNDELAETVSQFRNTMAENAKLVEGHNKPEYSRYYW